MRTLLTAALLLAGCASAPGVQHRSIAEGVDVYATRWEPEVLRGGSVSAQAAQRLNKRYGRHPSFIVVLELANRPATDKEDADPMLKPDAWSFSLRKGATLTGPSSVELVAHDRFPTSIGGHHERIAFAVHFAKLPAGGGVTLHVKAKAKHGRRAALGWLVAKRGVALRFDPTS